MKIENKEQDTIKLFGKTVHKTSLVFIAQVIAFWLMVLGFILFVVYWYQTTS